MVDIVNIKHVTKNYQVGDIVIHALKDIMLTIQNNEFSAMAGPSGSGKTTLLNLIGAIDTPSNGEISVKGQILNGLSAKEKCELRRDTIGFVFQSYNLIPVFTALENTEYILMLQKVPTKKRHDIAKGILDEVGLGDKTHHYPRQLSGGQQQRVAIARAIAACPPLILADEPTANVDSRTAGDLLDLMQRLHEEKGITFLFSTHDTAVMKRAKRLLWLKDGHITYDGPPQNFQLP